MRLSEHLKHIGLTQAEFAANIGTTQGTISRICAGRTPSVEIARKIVAFTEGKVSYTDLYAEIETAA